MSPSPLWSSLSAALAALGVWIALHPFKPFVRWGGLLMLQIAVMVQALVGWGAASQGSPTAQAAAWMVGAWAALNLIAAWILAFTSHYEVSLPASHASGGTWVPPAENVPEGDWRYLEKAVESLSKRAEPPGTDGPH